MGDWSGYGKGGAALVCGIYQLRTGKLKRGAERKIPKGQIDSLFSKLEIPDEIKTDLRDGYTALARESGAPAGGAKFAQLAAAHINLEIHFQAAAAALVSELRRLPDLKSESKPDLKPESKSNPEIGGKLKAGGQICD